MPKPPPTCSEMIRSRSGSSPSTFAISPCAIAGPWFESCSVRSSPSQTASAAWGSIGLLWYAGVA